MGLLDRLLRRRRLPAAAKPPLEGDERIVAFTDVGDGAYVVATTLGLRLPGRPERLGWHEIHKASWSGRVLTVIAGRRTGALPLPADETTEPVDVVVDEFVGSWQLLDPDQVPHQVRVRVQRSVAYTSHHPLPGGGGVRVVARRVRGVGSLRWAVRYDDGVDPTHPEVQAVTADLVVAARASLE